MHWNHPQTIPPPPSMEKLVLVTQLCPTLGHPMDCRPPGSPIHGIFQERILEWVAIPSSRGSSWPRDWTNVSLCLLHWQAGSLPTEPPRKPLLSLTKPVPGTRKVGDRRVRAWGSFNKKLFLFFLDAINFLFKKIKKSKNLCPLSLETRRTFATSSIKRVQQKWSCVSPKTRS